MRRIPKTLYLAIMMAGCFATNAFADYTLTLTGANPANYVMGGVYTSPYTFSTDDGHGHTGTGILLTCDDFITNVYLNEQWTATQVHMQTDMFGEATTNKTVKFDQAATVATQIRDYSAAAYLAAALLQWGGLHGYGNETAGEYSYAMWGIFDPTLLDNSYQAGLGANAEGKLTGTELSAAQGFLADAFAFVDNPANTVADAYIYTSKPATLAQEFIQVTGGNHVSMDEPSSIGVLAVDMLSVLGLVWVLRRRVARLMA